MIHTDEAQIKDQLGVMLRGTVEEALKAMPAAGEMDQRLGTARYEHCEASKFIRI